MEIEDFGDYAGQKNIYQQALLAEKNGDHQRAYELLKQLSTFEFWAADRDVQLHYAHACEKIGDYADAMHIYSSIMLQSPDMTKASDPLEHDSIADLNTLFEESPIQASNLNILRNVNEAHLVSRLFKYASKRVYEKGDTLCKVDDYANHMWLLLKGSVEVIVPNVDKRTIVGGANRPCLMGELAYFTGPQRSATLECVTQVHVLELSFQKIQSLLKQDESIQHMLDLLFRSRLAALALTKHDIFKTLTEAERNQISQCFKHTSYEPKRILVEQGKARDNAFMVQSGTILLMKKSEAGEFELVTSIVPGEMFHLGGLIKDFISPYRIVTATSCRLLRLKSETFKPMLEKHPWLEKALADHSLKSAKRAGTKSKKNLLWADRFNT